MKWTNMAVCSEGVPHQFGRKPNAVLKLVKAYHRAVGSQSTGRRLWGGFSDPQEHSLSAKAVWWNIHLVGLRTSSLLPSILDFGAAGYVADFPPLPQMSVTARAGGQEPGIQSRFPMWMAGTQLFEPSAGPPRESVCRKLEWRAELGSLVTS